MVRPVIVDGQHRLIAFQQLLTNPDYINYPHRSLVEQSELPVILLVLDERAGFKPSDPIGTSIFKTMRSIFIDLNKYARPVTAARQFLLDDRDLFAVCMRKILAEYTGPGEYDSIQSQVDATGTLPLALVDWYTENTKFDTGIHITTVPVMYELVKMALSLPDIQDKRSEYGEVSKYITALNARLKLDVLDSGYYANLLAWKDESENNEAPFVLRHRDIQTCGDRFSQSYGPKLVRLLVGIEPYTSLIKEYEVAGILGTVHENWMALDNNGKQAYVHGAEYDPGDETRQIAATKKQSPQNYGFQVVFQKAFIQSFIGTESVDKLLSDQWEFSLDEPYGLVNKWITRFNERLGQELRDPFLWQGAGLRVNDTIAWTQQMQNAISGFITVALVSPLEDWSGLPSDKTQAAAEQWIRDEVWGKIGASGSSSFERWLSQSSRPWRDEVRRRITTIASANEEDLDPVERDDRCAKHAAARLAKLIQNF